MQIPKKPAWIPYLQEASLVGKDTVYIRYNGGEITLKPSRTLSLLIYGESKDIPTNVIEEFGKFGVPIIFHKRNISQNMWITNGPRADVNDTLTKQILCRKDKRKRTYIARTLVQYKFKGQAKLIPNIIYPKLTKLSIDEIRNKEAIIANLFWKKYFELIERPEWFRRNKNPVSQTLNAASKFVSGILLRWISYHHMSPYHGFLHQPTDYPSLVYDLIEPYRYIIQRAILESYLETRVENSEKLTAISISKLKDLFDEEIYCVQTKQLVRRQQLLHGICLGLRAYFLGLGKRFIVPQEGEPRRGRSIKTNLTLPGKSAGYTKVILNTKPIRSII